jgi:dTDP-4-amino-4,6-dideoxygalactose transaminase
MDRIMEIARKNGLVVIEDAAHAAETEYKGRKIGTIGDITVFSFYATKNLCTAEGGMITTDNDEYAQRIRIMSLHGISKDAWNRYGKEGSWFYEVIDCGYKYNFTDIQASLGIHQLKKLEKNNAARTEWVRRYHEFFGEIPECQIPVEKEYTRHAWHLYPLRIDFSEMQCDRAEFMNALAAENIGASVHFIPVHMHPYYINRYGYRKEDLPIAYSQYMKEISVPLFPDMEEIDVNDVCMAVEKLIKFYRKNISVIKKIDNRDLNMRDIKSREYIDGHEVLKRMKSYYSPEEFEKIFEMIRVKASEIVLESISIYYEDEAIDFIRKGIDEYIDAMVAKA